MAFLLPSLEGRPGGMESPFKKWGQHLPNFVNDAHKIRCDAFIRETDDPKPAGI